MMRKRFTTLGHLAILGLGSVLLIAGWAKPGFPFHKERKTVQKLVAAYKEIHHHMEEGKLDWHHLEEELRPFAEPIRELGHHDNVDLFKPLVNSVRRQDQSGLEAAFEKIFFYLVRENLHRSADSAGKVENTVKGFIENARMAYGQLADIPGSTDEKVDHIFREMETTAREAQALKAKLAAKNTELKALLSEALKH